jgi:periplasmic protein TonB
MKQWILPVIFALAIHGLLFRLDLGWTRPAITIPESRSVTISLVHLPPRPVQPPVPPLAASPPASIAPLQTVPPPQRPVPRTPADPAPQADPPPDPTPLPEEMIPTVNEDDAPSNRAPHNEAPEKVAESAPEQAVVQASVPLYHLNPAPDYPAVARRRGYEGTVLLDVLVDREGRAAEVKVAQSSGYALLDRSALTNVRRWRFEPARRLGRPVEMWVQVPVRFALQ